ncbi:MAG: LacI family DNA-binding transcriptional regulator [Gammaproteobacteria bacterium]|nr:LacI family DNA-binding transcriptional regulator [Gammaproteobacteria bacterium]
MARKLSLSNKPAAHPVTSKDVAERAKVSRAAVSRTFSGNGSISEQTRNKVLKAAKELGYRVNMLGRSMNRQRADLVGLVVWRPQDPFRMVLLESLLQAIAGQGLEAIVTEVGSEADSGHAVERFVQYRVAGVIIISGSPPASVARECAELDIPVVMINREGKRRHADVVRSDNASSAQLVAERFLGAGCRRLGFLNVEGGTYSGADRGACFEEALTPHLASGAVSFHRLKAPSADYDGGYAATCALRDLPVTLDGVFCANDLLACGFLDGLRNELQLDVPGDIAVIGFDDIPVASWHNYRLTTIKQNTEAIAVTAVDRLLNDMDRRGRRRKIFLVPTTLIDRSTVGPRGDR